MNVFIVNGNGLYASMFKNRGWKVVDDINKANLIQFTGGEDVDPNLYGEAPHPETFVNKMRDKVEQQIYNKVKNKIPMTGICRGGQFLHVMNGGQMFQNVNNHGRSHKVRIEGEDIICSSTHHQMMRMYNPDVEILGYCFESTKKEYVRFDGKVDEYVGDDEDIEVLFYPNSSCLCFQPHPEFYQDECQDVYFNLIHRLLM